MPHVGGALGCPAITCTPPGCWQPPACSVSSELWANDCWRWFAQADAPADELDAL